MPAGLRYGVEIRAAQPADAAELARLLAQAGVAISVAVAAERLEAVRARPDGTVLVATGYGGLSGLVALHWAPGLQAAHPAAYVTALVVDSEERRRGIGRLLLKAASQAARAAGCDSMGLALGPGREDAAAFCLATGFSRDSAVFTRSLRRRGVRISRSGQASSVRSCRS